VKTKAKNKWRQQKVELCWRSTKMFKIDRESCEQL